MHTLSTSFVLGYHGCDRGVAAALVSGEPFQQSSNAYDWLGHGVYFWEANPRRALEYAREVQGRRDSSSRIQTPAVVGAIIDLGLCLDLMSADGLRQVAAAHASLEATMREAESAMPTNNADGLRRNLDCAVINWLHGLRHEQKLSPVDTVKGLFQEGDPLYEGSGFRKKTHIQICVCNLLSIKGVFHVPPGDFS